MGAALVVGVMRLQMRRKSVPLVLGESTLIPHWRTEDGSFLIYLNGDLSLESAHQIHVSPFLLLVLLFLILFSKRSFFISPLKMLQVSSLVCNFPLFISDFVFFVLNDKFRLVPPLCSFSSESY